jgi:hypothetical protein
MNVVHLPGSLVALDELHLTAYEMWKDSILEGDPMTMPAPTRRPLSA